MSPFSRFVQDRLQAVRTTSAAQTSNALCRLESRQRVAQKHGPLQVLMLSNLGRAILGNGWDRWNGWNWGLVTLRLDTDLHLLVWLHWCGLHWLSREEG
mmetsp:Transcript_72400/g.169654  ORF Transcript_72400/g.169654 Transcript_72400/m.169654 type:complete len:99 (-) Transcript_72400:884-1180(-)